MSVSFEQYNEEFRRALAEVESDLGKTMIYLGNDAIATIKARVQETGIDAKGSKFAPYSTEEMLVGCKSFRKKDCTGFFGKDKNKGLRWVSLGGKEKGTPLRRLAVLEGGYKRLRDMSGLRTDITNFSFTGDMWNDITLISSASEHESGIAVIGAKSEDNKKKLEGNTARRGDILDLSESEINELTNRFALRLVNIFKTHNVA